MYEPLCSLDHQSTGQNISLSEFAFTGRIVKACQDADSLCALFARSRETFRDGRAGGGAQGGEKEGSRSRDTVAVHVLHVRGHSTPRDVAADLSREIEFIALCLLLFRGLRLLLRRGYCYTFPTANQISSAMRGRKFLAFPRGH